MYQFSEKQRKNLTIRNHTNYWNPATSKLDITVSSPESYNFRKQKIEAAETRLYWEYRFTEEHSGQTFFYTLTYNDINIPKYEGKNCFDYEDLRDLLTGSFRKDLLRKFGTTFKYFISAELGDGKGERGFHNNPHYHCIFFLLPANNPRYPYKPISPRQFRHLVRLYWQGFDEDYGKVPYQLAKYGRIKEGDNLGRVNNFAALNYAAKYVCKDIGLICHEKKIIDVLFDRYLPMVRDDDGIRAEFFVNFVQPRLEFDDNDYSEVDFEFLLDYLRLNTDFDQFVFSKTEELVNDEIKVYRNRYCNKTRISQGVGEYALKHISNPLDPHVPVATKKGIIERPLGMYLYRKLFCDTVKDPEGHPIYVLNKLGQDYKVHKLPSQISKLEERTIANVNALDENIYNDMLKSPLNQGVDLPYVDFNKMLKNNKQKKLHDYATYKLVYEGRFWTYQTNGEDNSMSLPPIQPLNDYRRFLVPAYYTSDYCPGGVSDFLANSCEGYMAYDTHPYFLRNISLYRVLDLIADYLFVQGDIVFERKNNEYNAQKKFHNKLKLKDFYQKSSFFGV